MKWWFKMDLLWSWDLSVWSLHVFPSVGSLLVLQLPPSCTLVATPKCPQVWMDMWLVRLFVSWDRLRVTWQGFMDGWSGCINTMQWSAVILQLSDSYCLYSCEELLTSHCQGLFFYKTLYRVQYVWRIYEFMYKGLYTQCRVSSLIISFSAVSLLFFLYKTTSLQQLIVWRVIQPLPY